MPVAVNLGETSDDPQKKARQHRLLAADRRHRRSTRCSRSTTRSSPRSNRARRSSRSSYWPRFQPGPRQLSRVFRSSRSGATSSTRSSSPFAVVVLSLLLGITAAYALGRVRFRGRGVLLSPSWRLDVPAGRGAVRHVRADPRARPLQQPALGLILAYMIFTLPFTVWVLTTFMRDLPIGARGGGDHVDGAKPLRSWSPRSSCR
jgi:ABC-type glycerol-3-phosphate transport system permease component